MSPCPICSTPAREHLATPPHWICPGCRAWFMRPGPPEGPAGPMGEDERNINRELAAFLFQTCLGGRQGRTLDVGSSFPWLARCFQELGCDARALDLQEAPAWNEAGPPLLVADFEAIPGNRILEWAGGRRFQLITLVHVFDRFCDPLAALRKLRDLVEVNGRVFLRLPDPGVAGFERHKVECRRFFHSTESLLELLAQGGGLFTVERTQPHDGAGQRDVVLRPLERRPSISGFLIVKNEERDLPKCLRSIEGIVDGVVILDTGSTDRTFDVAVNTIAKPVLIASYLEASRQDASGDWKLWDFAKARNACLDRAERMPAVDWLLWMDADDTLENARGLLRSAYLDEIGAVAVQVESGSRWIHHRFWRAGRGVRFEGRVHEYPALGGLPCLLREDIVIHHDPAPGPGETSNDRNLRILEADLAAAPTPRTMFYLANTHRDGGRFLEAVPYYAMRIEAGPAYRDEWLFAHLFKARCERAGGRPADAERTLLEAVAREAGWAEFWMELAFIAFEQGRWTEALGHALQAHGKVPAPTQLWREANAYSDQPLRVISLCHERLGDIAGALAWARKAQEAIGCADAEWDAREAALSRSLPAGGAGHAWPKPGRIALVRPGAIGDVLMTLNLLPALRERLPGRPIHYFCSPWIGEQLWPLMRMAGIEGWRDVGDLPRVRGDYDTIFNLVGYPLEEGYPEKPMARHLIQYFARELGLDSTGLPALAPRLDPPPEAGGPYATLHATAAWSAYKNWPMDRWRQVVEACPGIPFYQLGAASDPRIPGARQEFMGAPLMASAALMAGARMHLGVDSFTNHLSHYRFNGSQVPGVILWGSTQWSASGYPHNINICLDLPCQPCFREDPATSRMPRPPCITPPGQDYEVPRHACMDGITAGAVVEAAQRLWRRA